jgi:Rieske Fe-S protein
MIKKFNNISGTTSSSYAIGVGKANATQYVVYAKCNLTDVAAKDKNNNEIPVDGVEFYDMKIVAKNAEGEIVAKQLRGTVNNTTVTRIEDIFQEEFSADVILTSNGRMLTVTCKSTGSLTNYTIYTTMVSIDI